MIESDAIALAFPTKSNFALRNAFEVAVQVTAAKCWYFLRYFLRFDVVNRDDPHDGPGRDDCENDDEKWEKQEWLWCHCALIKLQLNENFVLSLLFI